MAEVTLEGIMPTTLLEYQQQVEDAYLQIDPQWNLNPESPDGQVIGVWSEQLALLDEIVVNAYTSRDPATAVGQALDDIGDYAGLTRKAATFSTAVVTLGGVGGTLVPAGSEVRNTETDTIWTTDADATIPADVGVTCTTSGQEPASIGTLSEIASPVAGWQTVTNAAPAVQGSDEESDNQFRLRRNQSVALPGSNQVDNIFSAVFNVDGVIQARVYENPRNVVADDLTPNSIAVFVQGGDTAEIQSAIAAKKNPGCNMNDTASRNDASITPLPNEEQATTETPLGQLISITFFQPDTVPVFVDVTIDTDELSEGEKETMKQAIVDFSIEGLTGQGDGFTRRGFQIGERVAAGRLYTPVNEIVADRGFVESILVGTSAPAGATSVAVAFNELAVFDTANITVTYV